MPDVNRMTSITTSAAGQQHRSRMGRLRVYASRTLMLLLAVLIGALGMRAWMSRSAPDLKPWHLLVPEELDAKALESADWAQYIDAENRLFAEVSDEMRDQLDPEDRAQFNRYDPDSRVNPDRLAANWNRSLILEPAGRLSVSCSCCTA